MSEPSPHTITVWGVLASLAGAATAVSFMPWSKMRWAEIAMTLFVGSAFATFGVPYAVEKLTGIKLDNMQAVGFYMYIGATGVNVFLPIIIRGGKRWLEKFFGSENPA